jgi:LPXTG-motif cell wall-anchored protein
VAPTPTEAPTGDKIIIIADGNKYEVEAGTDHTYTFYLKDAGTICGIDATTTWDTPYITMVGDPSFPILGGEADIENPDDGGNVVVNYFNNDKGEINEMKFNYTNADGADFSGDKAEVVTFTIHVDENTPAGTYYIKEVVAPEGYNLSTVVTQVEIGADTATATSKTVTITNAKSILPKTGGPGTVMFYVIGASLIICAGALLVVVMKKRAK